MSSDFESYAVYWVPRCEDPLARFGAHWTGWCTDQGEPHDREGFFPRLSFEIPEITLETCRHGIHAVLKASFQLGEGRSRFLLEHCAARLAENMVAVPLPPLRLAVVDGQVSLVPRHGSSAIVALMTRIGRMLASIESAARGFAEDALPGLAAANGNGAVHALLPTGVQPFHMPLTDRLAETTAQRVLAELQPILAPLLIQRRQLNDIAVMGDPGEGRPLRLLQRYELRDGPVSGAGQAMSYAGPDLLAPTFGDRLARSGIAL